VGGRPIATGKGCLAAPVDLEAFHDPADLKVLFSEIHRPIVTRPLAAAEGGT